MDEPIRSDLLAFGPTAFSGKRSQGTGTAKLQPHGLVALHPPSTSPYRTPPSSLSSSTVRKPPSTRNALDIKRIYNSACDSGRSASHIDLRGIVLLDAQTPNSCAPTHAPTVTFSRRAACGPIVTLQSMSHQLRLDFFNFVCGRCLDHQRCDGKSCTKWILKSNERKFEGNK